MSDCGSRRLRRSSQYTIDAAIERLAYWRLNSKSTEAAFYLYILYSIQAIEGSPVALIRARDTLANSVLKKPELRDSESGPTASNGLEPKRGFLD